MEHWIDDIKDQFFTDGRVEELRQLAGRMDFKFIPKMPFAEQTFEIKDFRIFKGKRPKRLKGILWQQTPGAGLKSRIYDYLYYAEGKKRITTVFEFQSGAFRFPRFLIRPKGAGAFLKQLFGKTETLPYPDFPAFHKKYQVETEDPLLFEETISPAFMEYYFQTGQHSLEGEGNFLLFFQKNRLQPAKHIPEAYQTCLELIHSLHRREDEEYV